MRICLRAPEESRGFYLTAAAGVGRRGDSAAAFAGAFSRVSQKSSPSHGRAVSLSTLKAPGPAGGFLLLSARGLRPAYRKNPRV